MLGQRMLEVHNKNWREDVLGEEKWGKDTIKGIIRKKSQMKKKGQFGETKGK